MSVPVALENFRLICCNLANRRSTTAGNVISRYLNNNIVLSGIIAVNDGGSGQGNSASDLCPGSILAGADESGCLTHLRTTFVSVCLDKLLVRVSVIDISYKVVTLATSEPGGNRDGSCGDHD